MSELTFAQLTEPSSTRLNPAGRATGPDRHALCRGSGGRGLLALPDLLGIGVAGHEQSRGLGHLSDQFRLLGRDRPFRHPDFRHPASFPGRLAQPHRPGRRDHDGLRGLHGRSFPVHSPGSRLDGLFHAALSQPAQPLAQFPVAPDVRRRRHQHLSHGQLPVLVHRHAAGSGHRPRPRHR